MWFLAIRHLLSRKRQTALTLVGILLGTTAYVAISGMMLGFQSFIIDQLIDNDAHIRISAREEVITEHSMDADFFGEDALVRWVFPPSGRRDNAYILYPRGWFDRMDAVPEVAAYSQQLVTQAIVARGKVATAARLIGVDPVRQAQVTNIQKFILKGSFNDIGSSGNRIIVGDGLLNKMGGAILETLLLSVGKGEVQPFKVVGVFHLGLKGVDEGVIYGALSDVQKLNRTPSRISDIAVRLHDVAQAGPVASAWNVLSEERVQSWDQANEGLMSVFKTQDIVRNSMTVSILIVAGFGIYNILSMAVNQKRREIAILRSIGYESRDIVQLFLTQGVILGALGGLIGCIVGFWVCKIMGNIEVANRGMGDNHMLIVYFPGIYIRGFFLAFASASFASFLPAYGAGKLTPIGIIRSETS